MSELETEEDVKIDEAEASAQVAALESSADAQSAEAEADPASGEQDEAAGESPDGKDRAKPDSDHVPRARLNEEILKKKKLREEIEALRKQLQGKPQEQTRKEDAGSVESNPMPKLSDPGIEYDQAKHEAALEAWIGRKAESVVEQRERSRRQAEAQAQAQARTKTFDAKLRDYAAKNPDYVEAYEEAGDPTYPPHVNEAIFDSEIGPQIDHHLLKNPELRERISALPPSKALLELGKIEYQLSNPQPAKGATKPRITNAPPAIDRTAGSGGGRRDDFFDHCPGATFE